VLTAKINDRGTQGRLLRFLLTGGLAAGVQFAALAVLKRTAGPTLAFTLAFAASTATHYTLNRRWALPSARTDTRRQFGEYLLTVAVSYAINLGLFEFARRVLGLGVMSAAVIAIPPSTVVVWLLLNNRVFRQGE
jgi:putative flippase GtrA